MMTEDDVNRLFGECERRAPRKKTPPRHSFPRRALQRLFVLIWQRQK